MSVIQMRLAKPHPPFPATFVDGKLVVAVQMANIKGFSARSTRCMAAEDTGLTSKGKVGFSRKVKATVKVSHWVPLAYRMCPVGIHFVHHASCPMMSY